MTGMGFPETACTELMTPIASNAVGVCSTRRSAGFFCARVLAQTKERR
jgi:hypothetical protein